MCSLASENAQLTQMYQQVRTELGDVRRQQDEQMTQMQARMDDMARQQQAMQAWFTQEMDRRMSQFGSQFPPVVPHHAPARTGESASQAVDQRAVDDDVAEEDAPAENLYQN